MDREAYDARIRRCPRLGHELNFKYCRQGSRVEGRDCPCAKILDCWFEQFDVEGYLREHYGEEALQAILAEPRPKLVTIVELIEQARRRQAEK